MGGHGALTLLPPAPHHAQQLVDAIQLSLPELRAFMPWAHLEQTVETQYERLVEVQAAYWGGTEYTFHLFVDDELVGCASLMRRTLNALGLEIGYWVRTSHTGRGIATAAAKSLAVLGFEHFKCDRVQCAYNAGNAASQRVNEKAGFKTEGQLMYFEGQPTAQMLADGSGIEAYTSITALVRQDRSTLPWYPYVKSAMTVHDWQGAPLQL